MRPDDRIRLRHMIDAAEAALGFAAGRTRSDLESNQMLLFALVRAFSVVGEAAARLSEEGRAAAPDVPWRQIVAMRNRLIHAYFDIDRDILWTAIRDELPDLLARLESVPLD